MSFLQSAVLAAFDMIEIILRRSMPAGATRRRHLPRVLPGFLCVFSCFCRQKKEKSPKEKRPFFFIPRIVDTNAANPPRAAFSLFLSQQKQRNVGFILWCKVVVIGPARSR